MFVLVCVITVITTLLKAKVPYVPSKKSLIKEIFKYINPQKNQIFYDLGCGDGRIVFFLEKNYSLAGQGFEISLLPYLIAKVWRYIGKYQSKILFKDFFQANLSDANLVYCYLFPETVSKLYQKLKKECKSGTILISNTFQIKDLSPTEIIKINKQIAYIYKI